MSLSNLLNKNPKVTSVVAVLALAVALAVLFSQMRGTRRAGSRLGYHYDLGDGSLFVDEINPEGVIAPSGAQGVLAFVFSCGNCDDPSQRFAGFIESFTPEGLAAMKAGTPETLQQAELGHLIALPSTEPQWVPFSSEPGFQIQNAPVTKCETPIPCRP